MGYLLSRDSCLRLGLPATIQVRGWRNALRVLFGRYRLQVIVQPILSAALLNRRERRIAGAECA